MTLKYESEILFDLMKRDGDDAPSDVLPYESELKEKYLHQVEGAYPKLMDYRPEWLNYNLNAHLPADFPVETLSNVTSAIVDNVVPYAYGSAILKGSTKYRDIDTGEFLETFEEGRNLELVSVQMPGSTTTGKNLIIPFTSMNQSTVNGMTISENEIIGIPTNKGFNLMQDIYLEKDITYTLSFEIRDGLSNRVRIKDGDSLVVTNIQNSFTVPKTKMYTIVFENNANIENELHFKHPQLEYNSTATSYEPYKSNILTTSEEVELRGIGDIQDELNLLTGELTQRFTKIVVDGVNYKIINASANNDNTRRFDLNFSFETFVGEGNWITLEKMNASVISDKAVCVYDGFSAHPNRTTIASYNGIPVLFIEDKTVLSIAQANQWLQQNPITIQYELKTPTVKTVDLTVTDQDGKTTSIIRPIEGTMHLMTEGDTIKPLFSGEVPVEAITQNLASFIKE